MYGAQLALETESPIFAALSFVGRVSGGVYAIDLDSKSSERIVTHTLAWNNDDSATGYRLGAEAGFRLQINDSSFVTVTGAVNYFSEAVSLKSAAVTEPALHLDEETDYQAKLNLTFRAN